MEEFYGVQRETAGATPTMIRVIRICRKCGAKIFSDALERSSLPCVFLRRCIGGTIIIDATGGVGTYTVAADCTGTLSITGGPSFNMYVGPGALV
jgi:hypothetical protein